MPNIPNIPDGMIEEHVHWHTPSRQFCRWRSSYCSVASEKNRTHTGFRRGILDLARRLHQSVHGVGEFFARS